MRYVCVLFKLKLDEKRSIGSLKNSPSHGGAFSKVKRSIAYDEYPTINSEMLEPVYQTPPLDYEELSRLMNELYPYQSEFADDFDSASDFHMQKRYLGKLQRTIKYVDTK